VEEKHQESFYSTYNYVFHPSFKNINAKKQGTPLIKVIYLNTRKNVKSTIERMIVNYNSKKQRYKKLVFHHCTDSGNHIKLSTTKAKEMITSTMSTFDQLSDKGILSALVPENPCNEIDNLIRSSMEEYGDLDEETGEFYL
jgi:hypothetical protein